MSPDEENTFRALKDEALIRTSFWCRFGIHRWTKWSRPDTNSHMRFAKVDRECVCCGEYQFKNTRIN